MKKNLKLLLAALMAFSMIGVVSACAGQSENSSDGGSQSEAPAAEYTITFVVEGVQLESVTYTQGAESITEPTVPEKEGYVGAWEAYTLDGNATVNAVYTAIEYKVTFMVDGEPIATETYTVISVSSTV